MTRIEPFRTTGVYANSMGDAGEDVARLIYGDAKYERLRALKRRGTRRTSSGSTRTSDRSPLLMESMPQAPPSATEYLRLVGIAALIGIPAALAAALFLGLIHGLEDWLWLSSGLLGYAAPPWFFVLGLPVLGALLVVLARAFLPGDGGHPRSRVERGADAAVLRPRRRAGGGRNARVRRGARPRDAGDRARVRRRGRGAPPRAPRRAGGVVLSGAGAFSAISALFGGPLVAGMLLVERSECRIAPDPRVAARPGRGRDRLRDLRRLRELGRSRGAGTHRSEPAAVRGPPPGRPVDGDRGRYRVGAGADRHPPAGRGDRWTSGATRHAGLLLAGGVAVGALALAARALGADSQDVLFSGQASIGVAVDATSISVLLILLVQGVWPTP